MKLLLLAGAMLLSPFFPQALPASGPSQTASLVVRKCRDFDVTGKGDNPEWTKAEWHALRKLDPGGEAYESRFKILYSPKGIYVHFEGKDNKITTRYTEDFTNLFLGDVFEVFFHPGPQLPFYFEYEVNQLNKELVLLIPRFSTSFSGWVPWHYEKERMVKKAVLVAGEGKADAPIASWSAELFFPYALLNTWTNVPPVSGTVWNANFYRLDYDSGNMVKWAWSPVESSFHEYEKFGAIRFE